MSHLKIKMDTDSQFELFFNDKSIFIYLHRVNSGMLTVEMPPSGVEQHRSGGKAVWPTKRQNSQIPLNFFQRMHNWQ